MDAHGIFTENRFCGAHNGNDKKERQKNYVHSNAAIRWMKMTATMMLTGVQAKQKKHAQDNVEHALSPDPTAYK